MERVAKFHKPPRPNQEVIQELKAAGRGATDGRIRTIAMITVNPLNKVEVNCAGDMSDIRKSALLRGLLRLALQLMKNI